MSRGLGYGRGMLYGPGASTYKPFGAKISATPDQVAAVAAALVRPGGRTPPVRVCCAAGHETGTKIRFRLDDGVPRMDIEGTIAGTVYLDDVTPGAEQTSPGWSVRCTRCAKPGTIRAPEWVEERALETVRRWVDAGRPGPLRFRWT